jgi:hypothetical protein
VRLSSVLYRCVCATVFYCVCRSPLYGQSQLGNAASVSGEVTWEGERRAGSLFVELISSGRTMGRVSVAPDGRFDLGGVAPGEYELRLADIYGTAIQRQFVSVHGHVERVVFRLERAEGARPVSGTVTVYSFCTRRPPRPARNCCASPKPLKKERAKSRCGTCARRSPSFRPA